MNYRHQKRSAVPHYDVRPGDVVLLEGGGIGVVKYFGPTHFSNGNMIGVQLSSFQNVMWELCDGSVDGRRYFDCDPRCGCFVKSVKKVVNAASLLEKLIEVYEDNRVMTLALSKMKFDFERLHYQTEQVSMSTGQNWEELLMSTRSSLASPMDVPYSSRGPPQQHFSPGSDVQFTPEEAAFYNCLNASDSDDELGGFF